ncbi:hypothetical protein RclHR1_07080003 [Rhizophagus clarus]|uniref:Uncharacterized protein n=1 Tax=Rhizophagus clarus TaxID=94130 RepID=A0A2Z6RUW5_9GLOM|nr:hypothetical protein RclHR1_07080003 [Rhizophagus clarus]GES93299.1 hypothetical protein RCL_jg21095.t1 [Rhizophagus clarus]
MSERLRRPYVPKKSLTNIVLHGRCDHIDCERIRNNNPHMREQRENDIRMDIEETNRPTIAEPINGVGLYGNKIYNEMVKDII